MNEIENRQAQRFQFLKHLYDKTNDFYATKAKNPSTIVMFPAMELGEELGFTPIESGQIADYLVNKGLAKYVTQGRNIKIEPAGIEEIETALSEPEKPTDNFPANITNIINVEQITNSTLQQGTQHSTQTVSSKSAAIEEKSEDTKETETPAEEKKDKQGVNPAAKWTAIGVMATAIFGAIGVIGASYFNYLQVVTPSQLQATQTAKAQPISVASTTSSLGENKIVLSEYVDIFDFSNGDTEEWKPFEWDTGWIDFEKSGEIQVVDNDLVLGEHSGPFLKYPLDLKAEDAYASTTRNAIYKPIDAKVIGIVANIYYESEPQYSLEEVRAGFIIPYDVNGERLRNEDFLKKLTPNKWNTIIWSLYGPVWWAKKDKDNKWDELKELFGEEAYHLQVGRHLHDTKIEKIGIQFLVDSEGGPKEFKGTAYIDDIVLIYEHP